MLCRFMQGREWGNGGEVITKGFGDGPAFGHDGSGFLDCRATAPGVASVLHGDLGGPTNARHTLPARPAHFRHAKAWRPAAILFECRCVYGRCCARARRCCIRRSTRGRSGGGGGPRPGLLPGRHATHLHPEPGGCEGRGGVLTTAATSGCSPRGTRRTDRRAGRPDRRRPGRRGQIGPLRRSSAAGAPVSAPVCRRASAQPGPRMAHDCAGKPASCPGCPACPTFGRKGAPAPFRRDEWEPHAPGPTLPSQEPGQAGHPGQDGWYLRLFRRFPSELAAPVSRVGLRKLGHQTGAHAQHSDQRPMYASHRSNALLSATAWPSTFASLTEVRRAGRQPVHSCWEVATGAHGRAIPPRVAGPSASARWGIEV
jgi:hypothetical protein